MKDYKIDYGKLVKLSPSKIIATAIKDLMFYEYRVPISLVEEYNNALLEERKTNDIKK